MTYAAVVLRRLTERGFAVEAGGTPGEYVVTARREVPLPLRPRLHLPEALFDEYLAGLGRECGGVEEALGLVLVHVEEDLDTESWDGRNHTTELGVRREADGRAAWFVRAEPSPALPPWPADERAMEWRAYPPDGT